MEDLIRRMEIVERNCNLPKNQRDVIREAINVIENGGRSGAWMLKRGVCRNYAECAYCGASFEWNYGFRTLADRMKYCPNCGAKMEMMFK